LDPLSNRKSADLLTALSQEFSLVAATADEESDQTKKAIEAYYAGVLNPTATGSSASTASTARPAEQPPTTTTTMDLEPPVASTSQPIPRMKSVMDRPHPKVRTSGFWANKDRGVVVPGGTSRSRVARKASASRRGSVRAGPGGVRRVPSHKRKPSLSGSRTPTTTTPSTTASPPQQATHTRNLSINGLINAIREEGAATESTTTDFEEIDTDSDDDDGDQSRPTSLPWGAAPAPSTSDSDVPAVPAIPVIIERRPSTKSTRSSKPNLSLALNSLVPGSTPARGLSPSSPMRSPGGRFRRRSSHSVGLPSPVKPPPTSPLPPTPTPPNNINRSPSPAPSDNELVVVLEERPQSGIVTPTAAKAVLASMPSPRQSDWFEDDDADSDVDVGRRTPFSRTPELSRPASPSDEYIVPTPTSVMTAFQAPPRPPSSSVDFSKPIPRPTPAGRAPATAEARARATASAAMSRAGGPGLSLVVPPPNGIPANPRPGTSPLPTPTGRLTPGHLRNRQGGTMDAVKAPPPSTWIPPMSALTRISSMKSQRGREPDVQQQQQPQQQPQPQAARSHSRDDSNGSTASQRGRMSPFPVRPNPPSRDVSPLPSLKRTPSKMSTRQRSERVRSFHAEVGGDFDVEVLGRQSGESIRSGESEGWATASSTRSSNESGGRQLAAPRPRKFNDLPRDAYMPSPSPMSAIARRPSTHSRGPSPLPP
ncbi:hypothetical protein FRC01_012330, partial [Tulasnella sp. 417]